MHQSGVRFMCGVVKEVHSKKIVLNDGTDVPYGLLVWSTGVGPSDFVKSINLPKSPGGRYMLMQPTFLLHFLARYVFSTQSNQSDKSCLGSALMNG